MPKMIFNGSYRTNGKETVKQMSALKNRPSRHLNSNRIFLRITIGLILVLAVASAVAIYFDQESQMARIVQRKTTLASELSEVNANLADLQDLQNMADTDEYIERIAREKLGMVKPNEVIFED